MNEIRLERSEFLVLLNAINANVIVGMAPENLFPQDEEKRREILSQGLFLLEQNGRVGADHQPLPDLLKLARIVAYPQIAFIIIRNVQALGPQLFLLYQSPEGIIEQTFPAERVHRLAILPNIPLMLTRAVEILSLPEQLPIRVTVEIEQKVFFIVMIWHSKIDVKAL